MSTVTLSPEAQGTRDALAAIMDEYEYTVAWFTQNAYPALRKLQDRWQLACSEATLEGVAAFRDNCSELLADSAVLRLAITEQAERFANIAKNRLPAIAALAADDETITSLVKLAVDQWNADGQPHAVRLHGYVEQLEDGIQSAIDRIEQEVLP